MMDAKVGSTFLVVDSTPDIPMGWLNGNSRDMGCDVGPGSAPGEDCESSAPFCLSKLLDGSLTVCSDRRGEESRAGVFRLSVVPFADLDEGDIERGVSTMGGIVSSPPVMPAMQCDLVGLLASLVGE